MKVHSGQCPNCKKMDEKFEWLAAETGKIVNCENCGEYLISRFAEETLLRGKSIFLDLKKVEKSENEILYIHQNKEKEIFISRKNRASFPEIIDEVGA